MAHPQEGQSHLVFWATGSRSNRSETCLAGSPHSAQVEFSRRRATS